MLDIKFIRENKELVQEGAHKKKINISVDELLGVDDRRLALLREVEDLRGKQNAANEKITQAADPVVRQQVIDEMKLVKDDLQKKEEELKLVMKEWQLLMLQIPNIPDMTVPAGDSDEDNQEIKNWGEQPTFSFAAQDHISLMEKLDMVDLERGAKVSGFRGYFLKNDGARLAFAIWQLAQEHFLSKGFSPIIAPSLVKKENLFGSGYLPQGEDDLYKTQDGDYLAGTAEVAMMGYHSGEVLEAAQLPRKYLAFSPCFRREAGSHGKDVRGLIRVHEFFKLEQVILCEASHETSARLHEEVNRNTEEFIELLGIPYRTVINCGGDLGLGQVKKYDIELWVPLEKKYREISSASYFHDFQTRRLNIRYRDTEGKLRYVHSLNSTAIPTPRILVSLVENYQQADGTIKVPPALVKYFGKETIGPNS